MKAHCHSPPNVVGVGVGQEPVSVSAAGHPETPDVFCNLGSLIVEGRVPCSDDARGFGEGPHVPQAALLGNRHECSRDSYMCKKDENFRKHMLLLWQNNVPVSIEVLLCPDCRVGRKKARSVEFSTIPEPGSILLEQWTVSTQSLGQPRDAQGQGQVGGATTSSRGLFQAVRSYLHFSQLSAWLSSNRGERPKNLLYRITIPGEVFASKFTCQAEEHVFPQAVIGHQAAVSVSVRSLPRSEDIPKASCPYHAGVSSPSQSDDSSTSSSIGSGGSAVGDGGGVGSGGAGLPGEEHKLSMAGSLAWHDLNNADLNDVRKALVRTKLASAMSSASVSPAVAASECPAGSNLPRSDSMDSMLGDSLLDPPQSLQKIPPKRYQSPSRCGSPSLEAPEYLLFGSKRDKYDTMPGRNQSRERLARQDHLRRRDMNLFYGLHPRLLHASPPTSSSASNGKGACPNTSPAQAQISAQPRLSLPPRMPGSPLGPFRAYPPGPVPAPGSVAQHGRGPLPSLPLPVQDRPTLPMQLPCRAIRPSMLAQDSTGEEEPVDDRMLVKCTISGKHICSVEYEVEDERQPDWQLAAEPELESGEEHFEIRTLPDEQQQHCPLAIQSSIDSSPPETWTYEYAPEDGQAYTPKDEEDRLEDGFVEPETVAEIRPWQKSSVWPTRRCSLKEDECGDSPASPFEKPVPGCCKKRSSLHDIFDDGSNASPLVNPMPVAQVYRAETTTARAQPTPPMSPPPPPYSSCQDPPVGKSELLLNAIIRTSERNSRAGEDEEDEVGNDDERRKKMTLYDQFVQQQKHSKRLREEQERKSKAAAAAINTVSLGGSNEASFRTDLVLDQLSKPNNAAGILTPDKEPFPGEEITTSVPRIRSLSENAASRKQRANHEDDDDDNSYQLEPLDISFDLKSPLWPDPLQPSPTEEEEEKEGQEHLSKNLHETATATATANTTAIPTSDDQNQFRKSFNSAASMVFHGRTGLPLTSSPAPLRKGKGKGFEFDSSISSPHDIKRALYRNQSATVPSCKSSHDKENDDDDEDEEGDDDEEGLKKSDSAPLNPLNRPRRRTKSSRSNRGHRPQHSAGVGVGMGSGQGQSQGQGLSQSAPASVVTSSNLLGNFEESVLNGRLEPVSTVAGFTAEIGASGSFHPKHTVLPVTVFFYTLCDNNNVSSPYLGHINLSRKGYRVPKKGTIQVTLFNPLGTVVKMFVVVYDLSDMPANAQTFLRQRTLYMPSSASREESLNATDAQKWLRYLIHLRFISSKSGKLYLHTDLRMIIFRKSDLDTASDHTPGKGFELRSFTRGPTNPKFSPRR